MAFSAEPELVWMAHDRASSTPLDLLTHLVAGAVAQDIPHPHHVVLVTMSNAGGLRIEEWDGKKFVASTKPPPALPITAVGLRNLIPKIVVGMTTIWRGRVFVAHLDDPLHFPPSTDPHYGFNTNTKFDRAVLVTDTLPTIVRPELRALLDPKLFVSGTIGFGGIVSSVLVPPNDAGSFWTRWLGLAGIHFVGTDEPEDDELQSPGPLGEKLRLFRDSCFIVLDLPALAKLWGPWDAGGRVTAFINEVRSKLPPPANDAHVDIAHRWGRAATGRRVGVAVSGGGACAYRLVGLMKRLEDNGVPIDVVAGLSGGAFIGAYYCTLGRAGLDLAISRGPIFGALLPLAAVSTWFLQKAIDFDLGCARIEEAPVRYVAVTAGLASGSPPKSRLVTSGTIGEAVRVSGTLPPVFGPSRKGKPKKARYTDGGAASLVPAQIVRNCGADLTVSYNVLAGPKDSNPLSMLPFGIGDVLRDLPILGRVLDVWVWFTFLWARASRQFGMFADVPIAFDQDAQMIEAILWPLADWLAKRGYNDPEVIAQVAVVKTKWTNLHV